MSDVARKQNAKFDQAPRKGSGTPNLKIANQSVMTVKDLYKSYHKGKHEVPVLKGVSLSIEAGDFTAIVGQSGSGKSTLLHLLGTLDAPDSGEIHFNGSRIDNLPSRKKEALRNSEFLSLIHI